MLLDFILDNQEQEKANKTLSGYNNYTGQVLFDYNFEKPEKTNDRGDKDDDGDDKNSKYLKTKEIFLTL